MNFVEESLSKHVLTVGPDYRNHRGGIGAVIANYKTFFQAFHFFPTYKYFSSNIRKSLYFVQQAIVFGFKMLTAGRQFKIVHIHGSHSGSFYRKLVIYWIAKKLFGKKVIYHVHSSTFDEYYTESPSYQKKLIKKLVNGADLLICLAPYWKQFFTENFKPRQIVIVNNVVAKPSEMEGINRHQSGSALRLLFLGKIGGRKGIFDLISSIAERKELFENRIKLMVGGDGEIQRLESDIKHHDLSGIVEYVGWVDKERKDELLRNCDVYILPSYQEGLPMSVLEAMSYGLPIISTPVGGTPEVVFENKNGFLVQPGDKEAMAEKISFFINNPLEAREFGKASLDFVKPYLIDHVSSQLRAVYASLLQER